MTLSQNAVRYRAIVYSAVIVLMGWGIFTFFTMPRREDPEFTIRICVISTRWPGASTEKVEELVTDPLEEELISIEEVDEIRSTSRTGLSTIFVQLDNQTHPSDIQQVWDKVRSRVGNVEMPDPAVQPVVNDEFGDTSVLLLAVHQTPTGSQNAIRPQDRYSFRQLEQYAERVSDALRLLDGVAKVELFGVRDEVVTIETDLANWAQLDLTTSELQRLAASRNIIEPGGEIDTGISHYSVHPGGEFTAVDEILQVARVVQSGQGDNSVPLSELGLKVKRHYQDPPQLICRYGSVERSTPAISIGVTMKSGANIIGVCQASMDCVHQLTEIQQVLPRDIAVAAVSDQSENVIGKINEVIINVVEAIVIVVVVVLLVVGLRTALVMAANIPVVVMISIGTISMFAVQLEQISLAAIIISLGLLVDNAVQVCDQARTNQLLGMRPMQAAIEGASALSIPMLVGTLTTVAAFLPMLYALEGGSKEYVRSLPITVSVTLGLSWILAMTFCVLLAGMFIRTAGSAKEDSGTESESDRQDPPSPASNAQDLNRSLPYRVYGRIGIAAVRWKWCTVAMVILIGIGILLLGVSSEFFPDSQRDQFAVKIHLPENSSIHRTNEVAAEVEQIIRKLATTQINGEEVQRLRGMRTLVGGGGARWHLAWDPEPRSREFAEILIRTTDGALTVGYLNEIRRVCEHGDAERGILPVTGARIVPVRLAMGPPADPLVLRVIGSRFADQRTLRELSNEVKQMVADQPETWNVHDSWGCSGYQVSVDIDKDRATLAGLTNSQIAQTLNSYYSGLRLTTYREGDHQVPVYFRLDPGERSRMGGLQESYVEGDRGKVPLASVADFSLKWQPEKIERVDMDRVIEISSQIESGFTGNDVVNRVLNSDRMQDLQSRLPAGYRIEPGGAYKESHQASGQMATSFGLSFFLICFCLIVQYNGWSKPLLVLSTLPIALVGALLGLYLTDNTLGFMSQLGILALFGIVLNTAIIYIEFAEIIIRERSATGQLDATESNDPRMGLTSEEFYDALVEAGKQRMLPIFLTTATTIGGLLPLALGGGPLWEGLAWCMIVGLVFSTVLTLLVIPALYAILVEVFGVKAV